MIIPLKKTIVTKKFTKIINQLCIYNIGTEEIKIYDLTLTN